MALFDLIQDPHLSEYSLGYNYDGVLKQKCTVGKLITDIMQSRGKKECGVIFIQSHTNIAKSYGSIAYEHGKLFLDQLDNVWNTEVKNLNSTGWSGLDMDYWIGI